MEYRNALTLPSGITLTFGTDISGHELYSVSLRELGYLLGVLEGVLVFEAWLFLYTTAVRTDNELLVHKESFSECVFFYSIY